jgi:hypothetical protein
MRDEMARKRIDFYLEAASAWAEEIGGARTQEIIDRARREIGNFINDRVPEWERVRPKGSFDRH